MFKSEPDFKEFENLNLESVQIFFWEFKEENIRKHGGLIDAAKMMEETILIPQLRDDNFMVPFEYRVSDEMKQEGRLMHEVIYFRYG